jgi:choline kinase
MKALILASGEGKRLRPLTYKTPKPLLKIIEDKTILDYQMDNLIGCGINDIIITTGPFEDKIKEHVEKNYPDLNVSYVHNPRYETTNYIYSLWLTKDLIDDDIILLHGDLLFDKKLLERLINEKCENCVLVNRTINPPEKDFKAVIETGDTKSYAEDAFNRISDKIVLCPLYFDEGLCMEIDTREDLEMARKIFNCKEQT